MSKTKDSLIAKLEELESRFVQIAEEISDPVVASDVNKFVPLG